MLPSPCDSITIRASSAVFLFIGVQAQRRSPLVLNSLELVFQA